MILALLVMVPLLGGLLAWLLGRVSDSASRVAGLAAMGIDAGIVVSLWVFRGLEVLPQRRWKGWGLVMLRRNWKKRTGWVRPVDLRSKGLLMIL